MFKDDIKNLKEKQLFKALEHSRFLPNLFLLILIFAVLWAGSFYGGRFIASFILQNVTDSTLQISLRSIITCGFQVFTFFLWVKLVEKRAFSTVGFIHKNKLIKFFRGFFIGIFSTSIITLVLFLDGAIGIEIINNINISIGIFVQIILLVLGWLIQTVSEEIGMRGWLMPILGAKYSPLIAILFTSIIVGFIHLLVPTATLMSFINLTLSGIFLSLYAVSEDCLWGVWGCHFGWNLALGNIFAFSVSGFSPRGAAIFKIKVLGGDLLTGGSYGPEASLLATILVLVGIIFFSLQIKRKNNTNI